MQFNVVWYMLMNSLDKPPASVTRTEYGGCRLCQRIGNHPPGYMEPQSQNTTAFTLNPQLFIRQKTNFLSYKPQAKLFSCTDLYIGCEYISLT